MRFTGLPFWCIFHSFLQSVVVPEAHVENWVIPEVGEGSRCDPVGDGYLRHTTPTAWPAQDSQERRHTGGEAQSPPDM